MYFGIERAPEIEAALLHPALEIGLGDFVGRIQQRTFGREKRHRRIRVGDARGPARALWPGMARAEFVPGEIALVLDEQRAAVF